MVLRVHIVSILRLQQRKFFLVKLLILSLDYSAKFKFVLKLLLILQKNGGLRCQLAWFRIILYGKHKYMHVFSKCHLGNASITSQRYNMNVITPKP